MTASALYSVIARMPGCRDSVFHSGLEAPESFVQRIVWETLEAYTESVRQTELLAEWRGHFSHLLAGAPKVMPYETIAGADSEG